MSNFTLNHKIAVLNRKTKKRTQNEKFQNSQSMYSSVPNKRADPNKRAGRNFLGLQINVQGGMFLNKRAGRKISQKHRAIGLSSLSIHSIYGIPEKNFCKVAKMNKRAGSQ